MDKCRSSATGVHDFDETPEVVSPWVSEDHRNVVVLHAETDDQTRFVWQAILRIE